MRETCQKRRLRPVECRRGQPEVPATGRLQPVVPVAEVSGVGVHLQDLRLRIAEIEFDAKENLLGPDTMRLHEKFVMLQVVDQQWKDHLLALDHLKEGIGLRGYGQRDPLVEYKKESFELFTLMKERIEDQFVQYLFRLQPVLREAEGEVAESAPRRAPAALPSRRARNVNYSYGAAASGGQDAKVETFHRNAPKVGRNDPCPCGSGKKYKKCHGAAAAGA